MGNTVSAFGRYIFRGYLNCQISSVLKHVIANNVGDVSLYNTHCKVRSTRVVHFEEIAKFVREKGKLHRWEEMVEHLAHANNLEKCVSLILFETTMFPTFQSNYLFCFYTLLTDAIVYRLKNHQTVNVDRILNVTQSFIIDTKGVMILFHLLQRL